MTDERMGEHLWESIDRLPAEHSGIVFRHYHTAPEIRFGLAERIGNICHRRGLALAIAHDFDLARTLGAELVHNPVGNPLGLSFSRAVHSVDEARAARAEGAALVFVSPVYATRSHPERTVLGPLLALQIAREAGVPAIALGGMNAVSSALLEREGFYGWAGIDAWLEPEALRT
jgi:thiamine-phosphate pyrophosphorylase